MAVLKTRLKAIAGATPEAMKKALLQTGADILKLARQITPVETGSLKASGGVVPVDSNTVHVGYGGPGEYFVDRTGKRREPSEYAEHVEYGTSSRPATPYLRPAFMQSEDTFKARVKEEMKKLT
jgi:HK97 gp10 family phage protein